MKLEEIINFLDERIPPSLALEFDEVGFKKEYDLNQDISSIKIYMDLWPEDDDLSENTIIITHHPPLFVPKTPTYTVHSNWDIIKGGANEALAEKLNLNVGDCFDENTGIGRICSADCNFSEMKKVIVENFDYPRIVNEPDSNEKIKKVGIISGFGLKNPEYIRLACRKDLDMLISGDLTQETAMLAKQLDMTLIDLGHHESEVAGLYKLSDVLQELNIKTEVIDKNAIKTLEQ